MSDEVDVDVDVDVEVALGVTSNPTCGSVQTVGMCGGESSTVSTSSPSSLSANSAAQTVDTCNAPAKHDVESDAKAAEQVPTAAAAEGVKLSEAKNQTPVEANTSSRSANSSVSPVGTETEKVGVSSQPAPPRAGLLASMFPADSSGESQRFLSGFMDDMQADHSLISTLSPRDLELIGYNLMCRLSTLSAMAREGDLEERLAAEESPSVYERLFALEQEQLRQRRRIELLEAQLLAAVSVTAKSFRHGAQGKHGKSHRSQQQNKKRNSQPLSGVSASSRGGGGGGGGGGTGSHTDSERLAERDHIDQRSGALSDSERGSIAACSRDSLQLPEAALSSSSTNISAQQSVLTSAAAAQSTTQSSPASNDSSNSKVDTDSVSGKSVNQAAPALSPAHSPRAESAGVSVSTTATEGLSTSAPSSTPRVPVINPNLKPTANSFESLAVRIRENVPVEDRRIRFKIYPDCMVGSEIVDWVVGNAIGGITSRQVAVNLLRKLQSRGLLVGMVHPEKPFVDKTKFYRIELPENAVAEEGSFSSVAPAGGEVDTPRRAGRSNSGAAGAKDGVRGISPRPLPSSRRFSKQVGMVGVAAGTTRPRGASFRNLVNFDPRQVLAELADTVSSPSALRRRHRAKRKKRQEYRQRLEVEQSAAEAADAVALVAGEDALSEGVDSPRALAAAAAAAEITAATTRRADGTAVAAVAGGGSSRSVDHASVANSSVSSPAVVGVANHDTVDSAEAPSTGPQSSRTQYVAMLTENKQRMESADKLAKIFGLVPGEEDGGSRPSSSSSKRNKVKGVIDLSGRSLSSVPYKSLKKSHTTAILLSHNSIGVIRDAPLVQAIQRNGWHRTLLRLDLSHNRLTQLPTELGGLKKLQMLNVSYNKIREVPVAIGVLLDLENLDLSWNMLENLPSELVNLRRLHALNTSGNPLSEIPHEAQAQGRHAIIAHLKTIAAELAARKRTYRRQTRSHSTAVLSGNDAVDHQQSQDTDPLDESKSKSSDCSSSGLEDSVGASSTVASSTSASPAASASASVSASLDRETTKDGSHTEGERKAHGSLTRARVLNLVHDGQGLHSSRAFHYWLDKHLDFGAEIQTFMSAVRALCREIADDTLPKEITVSTLREKAMHLVDHHGEFMAMDTRTDMYAALEKASTFQDISNALTIGESEAVSFLQERYPDFLTWFTCNMDRFELDTSSEASEGVSPSPSQLREQAVRELLGTELTFCDVLTFYLQVIAGPLGNPGGDEHGLSEKQYRALSSCVRSLSSAHNNFACEVEMAGELLKQSRRGSQLRIATELNLLLDELESGNLYAVLFKYFPSMVRALSYGMLDPKFLSSLRSSCRSCVDADVSVSTMFAGPINRIADLLDLVQTVYDHSWETSEAEIEEKQGLERALERLKILVEPLRKMDERLIRYTELLEVHERVVDLDFALASSERKLILEGPIKIKCASDEEFQLTYWFLFDDLILVADVLDSGLQFRTSIALRGLKMIPSTEHGIEFSLDSKQSGVIRTQSQTTGACEEWCQSIQLLLR
eukprot:CAMPEP_0174234646 /NCGR_PEP_ID=MMETSP0417-20130205/4341_1 /TAXON_ID=242541 /ORGANISM="Mayorella sp, Strain BSH-02190019" /LENGTH=1527 /DNA_ID=CAMNT_0015313037 /DNA_START=52 /DNA_END=4632 /DNA_ORIENTATION=-